MRWILALLLPICSALADVAPDAGTKAAEKTLEPMSYGNALNVVFSLLIVVAVLFALAWVLRRSKGVLGAGNQKITVVSQLPVGVREKVLLLRVGEENVLVGYSGGGLQALHAWHGDIPADIAPDHTQPAAFGDYLSRLRNTRQTNRKGEGDS